MSYNTNSYPEDDKGVDEFLVDHKSSNIFHIGQSYEKKVATQQECTKCGSIEFNIAFGSYYTAVRCPKCGWEVCVHEG